MIHFSDDITQPIALAMTVVSLFLMLPTFILHRKYFRTFRHLQLAYLYYVIQSNGNKKDLSGCFSKNLFSSWLYFDFGFLPSFTKYIQKTKLLFSVLMLAVFLVIVFFIGTRFKNFALGKLNWKVIFNFFKTSVKIVYLPFLHWSIKYMNKEDKPVIPIIIYVVLTVYPMLQSISYKFLDLTKLDHQMKFVEFFDYLLIEVGVVLLNVGVIWKTNIPAIVYSVLWFIFVVLYAWNAHFAYRVTGRMIYIVGEFLMMAVFLIFLLQPQELNSKSFDMIFLCLIFLVDLVYFVFETRFYCVNGGLEQKEKKKKLRINLQKGSQTSSMKKSQVAPENYLPSAKEGDDKKETLDISQERSDYRFLDIQEDSVSRSEVTNGRTRKKSLMVEDLPDDFVAESQRTTNRQTTSKVIHLDPTIERHVAMRVSDRKRPTLSYKRFQWD